ncbi:penicillin-binding transpeptidase domain-containing protein [Pontibacter sp. G13]|uniref:penicillin-binding transpeptidase domain-containing protein n=1 Tax=Pontibacter sp. G13 TaxID=3074898 RepID=UPI002889C1BC|nr:penicillin-binding transpeptidase domain-containing protein [Pontibacter sp. G13]WNJ16742.1 penicillin-binding transpeptidase domain-containing protein [Pontibacter sp. G13]
MKSLSHIATGFLLFCTAFTLPLFAQETPPAITLPDVPYKVTMVFHQLDTDQWIYVHPERADSQYMPASTFKVPHSLIALETGVVQDTSQVFKWDGKKRGWSQWNRDHTLPSALKYSALWVYQEIARREGREAITEWIETYEYGTQELPGPIDMFWLNGALKISPRQQVEFLVKLYNEELPGDDRYQRMVKAMMQYDRPEDTYLHAKTGWGIDGDTNYGWFVGWTDSEEATWMFATLIESEEGGDDFRKDRMRLTLHALKQLGGWPE